MDIEQAKKEWVVDPEKEIALHAQWLEEVEREDEEAERRPPLPKTTIPIDHAMFHGVAGDIVLKLIPETESHPVAILVDVLMSYGSIIGKSAYFEVESTKHYGNLFAAKVGKSSKSRKGTASKRVSNIFENVDNDWFKTCKKTGLSTGEGLIHAVRDRVEKEKDNGDVMVLDPGVHDKRLFVYEGEFAQVLTVMTREGNTASENIRKAWDGESLEIMTRGNPIVATNPHISILGDITQEELNMKLSAKEGFNGFVNRFLWVFVERCAVRPIGGRELNWSVEIEQLEKAVNAALSRKRIFLDRNARELWKRFYYRVAEDGTSGLEGAAIGRAEPQVLRIAMLYALLDRSEKIQYEHLKAAIALWQYCEDSARMLFGGLSKEQKKIADALEGGPMTVSVIREKVFSRHRKLPQILDDLSGMLKAGYVEFGAGKDGIDRWSLTKKGAQ